MKIKRMILFMILISIVVAPALMAQAEHGTDGSSTSGIQWGAIVAGFTIAIAAAFGAMAQGKAIASAVEGVSRNPSAEGAIRLFLILGLAFIESLVIYALVISFIVSAQ